MDTMKIAEPEREPALYVNVTNAQFNTLTTDIANGVYEGNSSALLVHLIELGTDGGCNLHIDRIRAGAVVDIRVIDRPIDVKCIPLEITVY